jgi:hypothetical protein
MTAENSAHEICFIFQSLLERTGYTLDITTGQRKYGGPPPNWKGPAPGNGCEVSYFIIQYSVCLLLFLFKIHCAILLFASFHLYTST